jgi:uncharacterized protein (TIGR02646 family)
MLFLISKPLSADTISHLNTVQSAINAATDNIRAAKNAWENRSNNAAFVEIWATLETMCVGKGICNYCENNEATDIEHIYPKSFFPEMAFVWENYLLACKTCNSHYKLDKIAVFNPPGSTTRFDVVRGAVPPTKEVLMINPRTENPLDFLELNLRTGVFLEKHASPSRAFKQAEYTIEVLALNARDALREAREANTKTIFRKLQYAVCVKEATTFADLDTVVNKNEPFITLDTTRPLADVQSELLESIRIAITEAPHPTIWVEIKRQHASIPRIADLFARLPEALNW